MKHLSSTNQNSNKIENVPTPANNGDAANKLYVDTQTSGKQDTLVSGTNIKTLNGVTVLGSGNMNTPNTTYTEISTTEINDGTASTLRSISGRRSQAIVDKAVTAATVGSMGVVVHGASAGTARPTLHAQYTWIGSVEPTNMENGDVYLET